MATIFSSFFDFSVEGTDLDDKIFGYGIYKDVDAGEGDDLIWIKGIKNELVGSQGEDKIYSIGSLNASYGDYRAVNLVVEESIDADIVPVGVPVVFDSDRLINYGDSSVLVGDVGKFSIIAQGGEMSITNLDILFGGDTLKSHGDYNTLIGDVNDWDMKLTGNEVNLCDNVSDFDFRYFSSAVAEVTLDHSFNTSVDINNSTLTYGDDSLTSYGNHDILIGDVKNWTLSLTGGTITSFVDAKAWAFSLFSPASAEVSTLVVFQSDISYNNNTIAYGEDILTSYGNHGILIGDVKNWTLSLAGGTSIIDIDAKAFASSYFSSASATLEIGAGYLSSVNNNNNTITYGDDSLTSYGNNVILIGDVKDWMLSQTAATTTTYIELSAESSGSNSSTMASVSSLIATNFESGDNTTYNFGNDILTTYSDISSQNILIGDVAYMDIILQHGKSEAVFNDVWSNSFPINTTIHDNTFTLGDDILVSGKGDEHMWGDIREFHGQILDADDIPIFTLDSIDKLDIIDFLDEAGTNNLLTGGEDCFVFNIGASESIGDNVIYDFDVMGDAFGGDDTLLFVTDILDFDCENPDADDVDDLSTLIDLNLGDDVNGNLVVDVIDTNTNDSLGTITFSNIDYVLANAELAGYGIQVGADFA